MISLKSNKVNILPVRKPRKTKSNRNTVLINETVYFKLNLGYSILIPIDSKIRRVSREQAQQLIRKQTNWDKFADYMDQHPFEDLQ